MEEERSHAAKAAAKPASSKFDAVLKGKAMTMSYQVSECHCLSVQCI